MTDLFLSNMNTRADHRVFKDKRTDFGFCEKEFEMIYRFNRFEMASPHRQKHWQVDTR